MKKSYLLPGIAILGGCGGFALRRYQLRTAFEPDTGLPIPLAPATIGLIALCVVVALALFLLARNPNSLPMPHSSAFRSKRVMPLDGEIAGALLLGTGSAMYLMHWWQAKSGVLELIFAVFGIVAGICMAVTAMRNYHGGWRGQGSLLLLAPVFFACLWLMYSYQSWARDPVVSDYVFALFAIMTTMLALYFIAAYSFGSSKETPTLLFGYLAMFFCIIHVADHPELPELCLTLSMLCYLLPHMMVLKRNAEKAIPFSNPNARVKTQDANPGAADAALPQSDASDAEAGEALKEELTDE